MPIAGEWREGRAGKSSTDTNPYTGETLLEMALAGPDDLDEAYRKAAEVQREWAAMLPQERRDTIERAASVLERRKEEVIGWIVREAGGTRIRVKLEWWLVREGMKEAATYPMHATGEILPATISARDVERGMRLARRVQADEPNTAFGGEKLSGLGRFGGRWALDEFTTEHWVSVQHERRPYPL